MPNWQIYGLHFEGHDRQHQPFMSLAIDELSLGNSY